MRQREGVVIPKTETSLNRNEGESRSSTEEKRAAENHLLQDYRDRTLVQSPVFLCPFHTPLPVIISFPYETDHKGGLLIWIFGHCSTFPRWQVS